MLANMVNEYAEAYRTGDEKTKNRIERGLRQCGMDKATLMVLVKDILKKRFVTESFDMDLKCSIRVTKHDITEIVDMAIENTQFRRWCESCNQVGENRLGLRRAEFIAEGGDLEFAVLKPFEQNGDGEDIRYYLLTREKLLKSLKGWIERGSFACVHSGGIEVGIMQVKDADEIVQNALFGVVVY